MDENKEATTATENKAAPTVEELSAKISELTALLDKQKKATDAASADASKWKQSYRQTQSEQERAAAEAAERMKKTEDELAQYKERERKTANKARLMGIGYDEATAAVVAESLSADVSDNFFESQKVFLDNVKKTADIKALDSQGAPSAGKALSTKDVEEAEKAKMRAYFGLK